MTKTMTPVSETLADYIRNVSLREPEILHRLRKETAGLGGISVMQIEPLQGQLMAMLAKLVGARRYVEVGAFTGYSTLVMALAMPKDSEIIACDVSEEWTGIARRYWAEANVADRIDLRIAPAAETLESMLAAGQAGTFDLMFIDADKVSYDRYYELGLKLLRQGGLMMIDNVLWGGAVIDSDDQDADTRAIRALNEKLHDDSRVDLSLVTVGDGLTLARKR